MVGLENAHADVSAALLELEKLRDVLAVARIDLEKARDTPILTDEPECVSCTVYMTDLATLHSKYADRVNKLDDVRKSLEEIKSRPMLLGACTACPTLRRRRAQSLEPWLKPKQLAFLLIAMFAVLCLLILMSYAQIRPRWRRRIPTLEKS